MSLPKDFGNQYTGQRADGHAVQIVGNVGAVYPSQAEDLYQECRKALWQTNPQLTDFREDRRRLADAKGERVSGTCEWIKSNATYLSWLGSCPQLLWLSGGPGKGKTMLSIFLAEELERMEKESPKTIFIEYFCDNKDEKRNTAVGVLRGLIFQLLTKRKELYAHIIPAFRIQKDSLFTQSSFESLWTCFESMVRDASIATLFCVVDGLDECDETLLKTLLKRFRALFSTSTTNPCFLNLVVVSRERPEFVERELSGFPRIRLGPDADTDVDRYVESDITKFIHQKVYELSRDNNYPPGLQSYVKRAFQERAKGTFLWVGIVAKELENFAMGEVKDALDSFPPGLFKLYGRILHQIPDRRRATTAKILQWVVMAARPLTLSEIGAALGFADGDYFDCPIEKWALEKVNQCGHLLTTPSGIFDLSVSLIHQSAKDYLLRETVDLDPVLEFFRIKRDVANCQIARQCLDYLQGGALAHDSVYLNRLDAFPLLSYATNHWFEHAQCLSDPNLDVFDLSCPFYADQSTIRDSWLEMYNRLRLSGLKKSSLLSVASYFGILPLVEKLLCGSTQGERPQPNINREDHAKMTALHWAATRPGNEAIVRLLLMKGADPEAKTRKGYTGLHKAAQSGNETAVQLLLEEGVDVDSQSEDGKTALHYACQRDNDEVIQLLLKHKADPNAEDKYERTALHHAAEYGHETVVQLLLEHKADPNAKDKGETTVLHYAAEAGHETVVQLLLKHKADPNAMDGDGITALQVGIRTLECLSIEPRSIYSNEWAVSGLRATVQLLRDATPAE
jgi:ankyrin repeat protein